MINSHTKISPKIKNRDKYSLEEIDFCRKLGILYFADEDSEEDDCHISDISFAHNFMCDYCFHFRASS